MMVPLQVASENDQCLTSASCVVLFIRVRCYKANAVFRTKIWQLRDNVSILCVGSPKEAAESKELKGNT